MSTRFQLPEAECSLGYPESQLRVIFDAQQFRRLMLWMGGQTGAICEGRKYDHAKRAWEPDGCGPHGFVVYGHDVRNWLEGGRVLD